MLDPTSRYYSLETAFYTNAQGRRIAYKRRRFLPQGSALPLMSEVTVQDGDRLDLITARTLGVPEQFWRICDANNAMNPFDLTSEIGRVLRIAQPQFNEQSS
jgi:hypothetical protein